MTNLTELIEQWIREEEVSSLFLGLRAGSGASTAAHPIFIGRYAGFNDTVTNMIDDEHLHFTVAYNQALSDLKSKIPALIEQIEKIQKDRIKKEIIKLEIANKNKPRPDEYQRALTDIMRIICGMK